MWVEMGRPQKYLPYLSQHLGPLPSAAFLTSLEQEIPLKAMWLLMTRQEPESLLLQHFVRFSVIEDLGHSTEDHCWLRAQTEKIGVDLVGSSGFALYVYPISFPEGGVRHSYHFPKNISYSDLERSFQSLLDQLSG